MRPNVAQTIEELAGQLNHEEAAELSNYFAQVADWLRSKPRLSDSKETPNQAIQKLGRIMQGVVVQGHLGIERKRGERNVGNRAIDALVLALDEMGGKAPYAMGPKLAADGGWVVESDDPEKTVHSRAYSYPMLITCKDGYFTLTQTGRDWAARLRLSGKRIRSEVKSKPLKTLAEMEAAEEAELLARANQ